MPPYQNDGEFRWGLHYGGPPSGTPMLILIAEGGNPLANNEAIFYSLDNGLTWNNSPTPAINQYFTAGAWSPDRGEILLLRGDGLMLRSEDGITYAAHANDIGNRNWQEMIWSPGLQLYIAVGIGGPSATNRIATSPDGVTWTIRNSIVNRTWVKIKDCLDTFGVLVAGASNSSTTPLLTSPDGINWSQPPAAALNFGGDELAVRTLPGQERILFGVRTDIRPRFTNDLLNFTVATNNVGGGQTCCAYSPNDDIWVVGSSAQFVRGPAAGDPIWTLINNTASWVSVEICEWLTGSEEFMAVRTVTGTETNTRIHRSSDGITWTTLTPGLPTSSFATLLEVVI